VLDGAAAAHAPSTPTSSRSTAAGRSWPPRALWTPIEHRRPPRQFGFHRE